MIDKVCILCGGDYDLDHGIHGACWVRWRNAHAPPVESTGYKYPPAPCTADAQPRCAFGITEFQECDRPLHHTGPHGPRRERDSSHGKEAGADVPGGHAGAAAHTQEAGEAKGTKGGEGRPGDCAGPPEVPRVQPVTPNASPAQYVPCAGCNLPAYRSPLATDNMLTFCSEMCEEDSRPSGVCPHEDGTDPDEPSNRGWICAICEPERVAPSSGVDEVQLRSDERVGTLDNVCKWLAGNGYRKAARALFDNRSLFYSATPFTRKGEP